jgi:hypothetical protein
MSGIFPLLAVPSPAAEDVASARPEIESIPGFKEATADHNSFVAAQYTNGNNSACKESGPWDILVIHEGLVEELVAKKRFSIGMEFSYLKHVTRVVRASGKGPQPRQLFQRMPFTEYSAINAAIRPFRDDNGVARLGVEKLMLANSVLNAGCPNHD